MHLLAQGLIRGSVHFAMAVAGLIAHATAGGLLGWMDPFWKGDKGLFVLSIGIPLLVVETFVFLLLLQWKSPNAMDRMRTIAVAVAAFVGGAAFPLIVGATINVIGSQARDSDSGLWLPYGLVGGAVACAAVTSILTWLFASILRRNRATP